MTASTPDQMRELADRADEAGAFEVMETEIMDELVVSLRTAADQLEAVRKALDESIPPYNSELRPDGSEDPLMAAYVDGVKDVYLPIDAILTADTAPQEDR